MKTTRIIHSIAGISLLMAAGADAATILTFDNNRSSGKVQIPDAYTYGSRAQGSNDGDIIQDSSKNNLAYTVKRDADGTIGTPNIALTWNGTNWYAYNSAWATGSGGVGQFMGGTGSGNQRSFTMTPDAGYGIALDSVQFIGDTVNNIFQVTVLIYEAGTTNLLWEKQTSSWTVTGNDMATDAIDFSFDGFTANQAIDVVFRKDTAGGSGGTPGNNLAIDNFTFSQLALIPEPSTATLGLLGLFGLAFRRKK